MRKQPGMEKKTRLAQLKAAVANGSGRREGDKPVPSECSYCMNRKRNFQHQTVSSLASVRTLSAAMQEQQLLIPSMAENRDEQTCN